MKTDSIAKRRSDRTWMTAESCKLLDFVKLIAGETSLSDYPLASAVQSNVLVYEGDAVMTAAKDPDHRKALTAEWAEAIYSGPGILVFKKCLPRQNRA
jgi:hypothetical protein